MNPSFATAGVGDWGFILVFGAFSIGLMAMLFTAVVCVKTKSSKAGFVVLSIIVLQGVLFRPWNVEKPYNTDDPDQIEEQRGNKKLAVVWISVSAACVAMLIVAYFRKEGLSQEKNCIADQ